MTAKRALAFNLGQLEHGEGISESIGLLNEIPKEEKTANDFIHQANLHHLSGNIKGSFDNIICSISLDITEKALDRFSIYSKMLSNEEATSYRAILLKTIGTKEGDIWNILKEGSIDPAVWKTAAWYFLDRGDQVGFFQFLEDKLNTDDKALHAIVSAVEEISKLHPNFALKIMSSVVGRVEVQRYLNFFGSLQRKSGLLVEAKETYLRSIKIDGKNDPAWCGLGSTYRDMGEIDKARQAFEKAPNHRKSRDRLKEMLDSPTSGV